VSSLLASGLHATGWAVVVSAISTAIVAFALLASVKANSRLAASLRLATLQQMVVEMDELRRIRVNDPALERVLFPTRASWSDLDIKRYVMAVQLANIFEWAYLARRDHLLDRDIWESWWETWQGVILASPSIKGSLEETVWTFGRSPQVRQDLDRLLNSQPGEPIPDPFQSRGMLTRLLLGGSI